MLRRMNSNEKLKTVTVYAEDYGRREGGGMRMQPHYEYNHPVKLTCLIEGGNVEIRQSDPDDLDWDMDEVQGDADDIYKSK